MADSAVAITAGAGTNVDTRTEATNGDHRQVMVVGDPSTNAGVAPVDATYGLAVRQIAGAASPAKAEDAASNDADVGMAMLAVRKATPADTSGSDGDYEFLQMKSGRLWASAVLEAGSALIGQVIGAQVTVSTSVTKSTTTTTYTANDNWADSTSAPTAGGYTFTGCARGSGGSGIITDAIISCSVDPALPLQGEIWILDGAFAVNDNDNAAFTCSDADALLLIGVIPFTLASTVAGSGTTSYAHIQNLSIGFTCVGSANLRFKVKVKNAYVNTASEVLNVRLKIVQTN